MVNFNITKEEFDSLENLISLNKVLVSDQRFNDMNSRNKLIRGIQLCFLTSYYSVVGEKGSQKAKELLNSKTLTPEEGRLRKFAEAYATAVVLGYFQSFNSDREVADNLPEFGYVTIEDSMTSSFSVYFNISGNDNIPLLSKGLLCDIRTISDKEYFEQQLYKEDLKFLNSVIAADIDDGYNVKMLKAIETNDDIATKIDSYMDNLKAFYTYLLEDSFGIEPFVGVLINENGFIEVSDSNNAIKINRGESTLQKLATRLNSNITGKVHISEQRQFDYDTIFSSDKVVYHPYKTLEYVLGRESTLNINRNIYKPSAYAQSWESYSNNYVFKNLRAILVRGFYKALERILLGAKVISGGFASTSFSSKILDYDKYITDISISSEHHFDKLDKYISKLVDSMSCFYILSKYGYLAKKITILNVRLSLGTRFSCFNKDVSSSELLFKNLITNNENEVFTPPYNLSESRTTESNVRLATDILDFQYNVNPMLSSAEPLFGYVIQQANQRKGMESNWGRILIGRSYSGKELYASDTSDIKLQENFIHNIIAGSRSGKGVMTMNILVSALAAKKPIFYLDRKPDMASMLYQYSLGKQFIVNGGLINANDDVFKKFDEETGVALDYWRKITKPYLDAHPEIKQLFGVSNSSYQGVLGDYIYFRAALFCLGLCVIRSAANGKDGEIFHKLNGKDGIVIVFDELTGFQNNISQVLSTISSPMVSKALVLGEVDTIIQKREELLGKIRVAQAKVAEATKDSAKMKAEEEIRLLNTKLSNLVDEQSLYAATLFKKITSSYNTLVSQKVAGFKQGEFKFTDIFVLGQFLDANYYTSSNKGTVSPVFFPLKSDGSDYYAEYRGADIIRSFLEELGEGDWFLGRNPDYNYANKSITPQSVSVCDKDGNWDYIGKCTCNEVRGVDSTIFNHVYFKPYLVLNTSDEADPPLSGIGSTPVVSENGVKSYVYVAQCAERTNKAAGGFNLWESVRVKHLTAEAKETYSESNKNYDKLHEGVGFKGLVRETLLTTESGKEAAKGDINEYIASSLGKSGTIADFVAQKMGYNCWQELIFDLSPEGIFSLEDMRNAVLEPSKYTLESRLPLHTALGVSLGGNEVQSYVPELPTDYDDFDGGYETSTVETDSYSTDFTENTDTFHNTDSESALEKLKRLEAEQRAREEAERRAREAEQRAREAEARDRAQSEVQYARLSDESLWNLVSILVLKINGYTDLSSSNQDKVCNELFAYFRKAGV